uniref:Acid phosphatase n=1 Tax=Strongyloides stercoralis TaxID=6248 RepID=A0A0K0EP21_STRER
MSKNLQNQSIEELLNLPPKVENINNRPISRRGRNFEEEKISIEVPLNESSGNDSRNDTGRTSIQSKSHLEFVNFDRPSTKLSSNSSSNSLVYSDNSTTTSSDTTSSTTDSIKNEDNINNLKSSNVFTSLIGNNEKDYQSALNIQSEENLNNLPSPSTKVNIKDEEKEIKLPGKNLIKKVIKPHSASLYEKKSRLLLEENSAKVRNLNNDKQYIHRKVSLPKSNMLEEQNDKLERSKACYDAWLKKKNFEATKKKEMINFIKKKEEEEKEMKMQMSLKIFEKWKSDYEEKMKETNLKKKNQREEENKKKEIEENKRKEAEKMFLAWKREHDNRLKEQLKKKEEEKLIKEQKTKDEKKEKLNESIKAFETWKHQKEKEMEENKRINKEKLAMLKKRKEEEKEFKSAIAREAFEIWLTMKKQENEYKKTLVYKIEKFENETKKKFKVPWIPPSNTIPKTIHDRLSKSSHSLSRDSTTKKYKKNVGNESSKPTSLKGRRQTSSTPIKRTKSVSFLPWR